MIGLNVELQKNGGDVGKLNLTENGEPVMDKQTFVEMLMGVVGAPFDTEKLTPEEKATLNGLSAYIQTAHENN